MNENFDLIWHTPPPKFSDWAEPMPFEFGFEVCNEKMEVIQVTVSGFWDFYYQEIEELTILDGFKKDITKEYDNEDYKSAIEKEVKLNYL